MTSGEFLNAMLRTGFISDCLLLTKDGAEIPVHTMVLGGRSEYFRTMLQGSFKEAKERGFSLDCGEGSARKLLDFIYGFSVPVLGDNLFETCELANVARMCLFPSLHAACVKHVTAALNPANACGAYMGAKSYGLEGVQGEAMKLITGSPKEALGGEDFLHLDFESMETLLKSDQLACDEVFLFQAFVKYLSSNQDAKGLVKLIRFPTMTSDQLAAVVAPSKLVPDDEMLQLFLYACGQGKAGIVKYPTKIRMSPTLSAIFIECWGAGGAGGQYERGNHGNSFIPEILNLLFS